MHGMFTRILDTIDGLVNRFLLWLGVRSQRPPSPPRRPASKRRRSATILYILLAGSLCMVSACCLLYLGVRTIAPVAPPEMGPTLTATPFFPARMTLTPFVPDAGVSSGGDATPGVLPLMTPTPSLANVPWAPYAGPIYPALTQIPPPEEEFDDSDDILNIALLGSDQRPYGGGFRTDTIIILILNKASKKASMVSFPRDLYVYIPAYGMDRINGAFPEGYSINYSGGGFGLFQDTMKYNFGLTVHHYAMMNFWGFQDLIDQLGGIDVYCAYGLTDKRQGMGDYSVPSGWNHMDGETALWYVRSRYTTSDFDRNRRQQEVILGIGQTLLNKNALSDIPSFFVTLANYVQSDLTLEMVEPFAEMASSLSISSIGRAAVVPNNYARNWITPDGKMVVLPDYDAIHSLLAGLLAP
jgi:LCP family protein required for cell wall assembly